ncbi:DUF819 family protein, partial [Burkholderia multivorans]
MSKLSVAEADAEEEGSLTLPALFGLLAFSLLVSALAAQVGDLLPEVGAVINASTWTILIVSVLGLIIGST